LAYETYSSPFGFIICQSSTSFLNLFYRNKVSTCFSLVDKLLYLQQIVLLAHKLTILKTVLFTHNQTCHVMITLNPSLTLISSLTEGCSSVSADFFYLEAWHILLFNQVWIIKVPIGHELLLLFGLGCSPASCVGRVL
jgi:hypothetical protein